MAPLPKRRHSTQRQGKREKANLAFKLPSLIPCPVCGKPKLSHRKCPNCGVYRKNEEKE